MFFKGVKIFNIFERKKTLKKVYLGFGWQAGKQLANRSRSEKN